MQWFKYGQMQELQRNVHALVFSQISFQIYLQRLQLAIAFIASSQIGDVKRHIFFL